MSSLWLSDSCGYTLPHTWNEERVRGDIPNKSIFVSPLSLIESLGKSVKNAFSYEKQKTLLAVVKQRGVHFSHITRNLLVGGSLVCSAVQ